jgi:hypothetical protein
MENQEPVEVRFVDLGIERGIRTIEVYDAKTGEKIGYDQVAVDQP